MPVVACPTCGKPSAASFVEPDAMHCAACGYRGTPPPDVVQSLREAAAVVANSPIEARQLSESVKRALASGDVYRRRFTWIFALCSAPVMLIALRGFYGVITSETSDEGGHAFISGMFVAAIVETVLLGILGRMLLARRQRAMEDACAATPPAAPGEPTTCHLCGAPLVEHAEAFVRCGFCDTDNLVSPAVLGRVRGVLAPWYGSQSAAVERVFSAMRDVNRGATALMIVGAVAVPPLVFVQFIIVGTIVELTYSEVDMSVRYTVVKTPAGDCVGRVDSRKDNTATVAFGDTRPPGLPEVMHVPTSHIKAFPVTKLKGKGVRSPDGVVGKVKRIVGTPLGNSVVIPIGTSIPKQTSAAGLCLLRGEKVP